MTASVKLTGVQVSSRGNLLDGSGGLKNRLGFSAGVSPPLAALNPRYLLRSYGQKRPSPSADEKLINHFGAATVLRP